MNTFTPDFRYVLVYLELANTILTGIKNKILQLLLFSRVYYTCIVLHFTALIFLHLNYK